MKLALIGYGQMGKAMAERWFNMPEISEILLIKRSFAEAKPNDLPAHVHCQAAVSFLKEWPADIILLAMKPQQMAELLDDIKTLIKPHTLIITVAVALPLTFYQQALSAKQPIVRIMPNTPSQVGAGMNVGVATDTVSTNQRHLVEQLFAAIGQWAWLADEKQMDTVSAISGSGPAYYYLFTELLAAWGAQHGLAADLAAQLARQTLVGSGALLADRSIQTPAELRQAVTSKGGVTAAALNVFQQNDALAELISQALSANLARSMEMAGGQ